MKKPSTFALHVKAICRLAVMSSFAATKSGSLKEVMDFVNLTRIIKANLIAALADGKVTFAEGLALMFTAYPALNEAIKDSAGALAWFAEHTEEEVDELFSQVPGLVGNHAWEHVVYGTIHYGMSAALFVSKPAA